VKIPTSHVAAPASDLKSKTQPTKPYDIVQEWSVSST
jgi:hypothetical protein